jgi:hypothetical protein
MIKAEAGRVARVPMWEPAKTNDMQAERSAWV